MDAAFKLLKEVENSRTTPIDGNTCREVIAENIRMREALEQVRSYTVDIVAGRINYRPHDHIQVIDHALSTSNRVTASDKQ